MLKTRSITKKRLTPDELGQPIHFIDKKKPEPMDTSTSSYVVFEILNADIHAEFMALLTDLSRFVEVEQMSKSTFRIDRSDIIAVIAGFAKEHALNPATDKVYVLDTRNLSGTMKDYHGIREVNEWNLADHKIFPGKIPDDFEFPEVDE